MMNKIYILTKMFLKNSTSNNNETKHSISSKIISVLIVFGMVGFVSVVVIPQIVSPIYDLFHSMNQKQEFLNFGLAIITVLNFRFGLSFGTKAFYSTKEVEMLLPLPIKFSEILSAKFLGVMIFQIVCSTIFLAPLLIVYGIKASLGTFYWIASIAVALIIPIIPTVLSTLLSIIVLRFTNIGKHKEKLKAIGIIGAMIIGVLVSIFSPTDMLSGSNESTLLNAIMFGTNMIIWLINLIAPTTKWATYFLTGFSTFEITINFILFVLTSISSIILFIIIGQNLYFKSVSGTSQSFSKKEKLSHKEFEKNTRENSKFKSYTIKELKLLIRNPVFLAISIGINFILPIFLIGVFVMNKNTSISIHWIYDFLKQKELMGTVICVIYGVVLIINGNNILASTSITREGSSMYINKYIPMCYREQIFSKICSVLLINLISSLSIALILIFTLKLSIGISIFIILITLVANIISSILGVIFDVNSPRLNWDDEYSILKMNWNNFITTIITFIIGVINICFAIIFKPNLIVAGVSIVILSSIIITSAIYYIVTKGVKVYSKIN